jgi:hypothetical protein
MAASLKTPLFVLLGLMLGSGVCAAEALDDPTRPAFDLVPGLSGQDGTLLVIPVVPKGLQSVILSTKREAAIINGTEVEVGHKYGDATLTVVNETCVVLMGPQGRQVMHMFPAVNLSKTELACVGRNGLQTIREASAKPVVKRKSRQKSAPAKKKAVTCADDDTKNGSEK